MFLFLRFLGFIREIRKKVSFAKIYMCKKGRKRERRAFMDLHKRVDATILGFGNLGIGQLVLLPFLSPPWSSQREKR